MEHVWGSGKNRNFGTRQTHLLYFEDKLLCVCTGSLVQCASPEFPSFGLCSSRASVLLEERGHCQRKNRFGFLVFEPVPLSHTGYVTLKCQGTSWTFFPELLVGSAILTSKAEGRVELCQWIHLTSRVHGHCVNLMKCLIRILHFLSIIIQTFNKKEILRVSRDYCPSYRVSWCSFCDRRKIDVVKLFLDENLQS